VKYVFGFCILIGGVSAFLGLFWESLQLRMPWRMIACGGLTVIAGIIGVRLTEEMDR